MSNKKLLVGLVAVALMLWVGVPQASAVTVAELQAQIQALLVQLQTLQGVGTTACTFTRDLTVGSSGADVTCLQNYLISTGHYTFSGGATGYFGEITKAAVAAWQTANGVSSTGYFGPLSQAKYTALAGTTTPTCPAGQFDPTTGLPCGTISTLPAGCTSTTGYSTTTGLPCTSVQLPAGCTSATGYSSTTGLPCGTTPTGVSDGKLTTVAVTLESSPADGTDLASDYKGIALLKEKIRVSSSPGTLKQFGIQTTNRSWLYWINAYLYDGSGNLIGAKKGLTSADFSEVTVGSKYNLTFDNLNYALPVDTDVYVTLKVDAISDTGRTAASGLIIQQDTNQVVVLDANDSYSVSTGFGTGTSSDRTWDWIAAQTGNAVPSNNGALAAGARWIKVSQQTTTNNVTMAVFDIKAESKDIEINTLKASASSSGDTLSTDITSWDLYEGACATDGSTSGCTGPLAGGSVAAAETTGLTITFSNLTIQIPKDTKKTFTIKALWADESDFTASDMAAGASTTVFAHASWITGVDKPTFNTLTVSGSNVTAAGTYAVLYAPVLSNTSLTMVKSNPEYIGDLKMKFTMKADGGNLYISNLVNTLLATSTTASNTLAYGNGGLISIVPDPAIVSCDSDGSSLYCIPNGESRTFTITGAVTNQYGSAGGNSTGATRNFKATKLYFDDDTSGLQEFWFDSSFNGMGAFSADAWLDVADRN